MHTVRLHLCFLKIILGNRYVRFKNVMFPSTQRQILLKFNQTHLKLRSCQLQQNVLKLCKTHIICWFCNQIDNLTRIFSQLTFNFWKHNIINNSSIRRTHCWILSLTNIYLLNIINSNIFWKLDLSKFLSKKDLIIESFVFENNIWLFFSTGKFIKIDKFNADIIFKQDLNIHDVDLVTTNKDYFIFNHSKGKVYFYKQWIF